MDDTYRDYMNSIHGDETMGDVKYRGLINNMFDLRLDLSGLLTPKRISVKARGKLEHKRQLWNRELLKGEGGEHGFSPPTEDDQMEALELTNEQDDEQTTTATPLAVVVATTIATAMTGFAGVNPADFARKTFTDEKQRYESFSNRKDDILATLQQDIFGDISAELTQAGSKIINLKKDRREEVKTCANVLASSKMTDFYSVEKAGSQYVDSARELLETQMTTDQLNLVVTNMARGLIREMNLDESMIAKLKITGMISDEFDPNRIDYSFPLFKTGGLSVTPPPRFNELWDGAAKPLICNTLSYMDIYIDKYVDCYSEATFESACPRLDNALANIGNDAIRQIEPQVHQHVAAAGRDMAQAQIDMITDQSYGMMANVMMWFITVVTYYFIMAIYKKGMGQRVRSDTRMMLGN